MPKTNTRVERFLEPGDVGQRAQVSSALVRRDALVGRIVVAGRTARGTHLFREEDVEAYLAERLARQGARQRRGR